MIDAPTQRVTIVSERNLHTCVHRLLFVNAAWYDAVCEKRGTKKVVYGPWKQTKDNSERTLSYELSLNYSIGPKKTTGCVHVIRCDVKVCCIADWASMLVSSWTFDKRRVVYSSSIRYAPAATTNTAAAVAVRRYEAQKIQRVRAGHLYIVDTEVRTPK